jgi:hypothetical protein
MVNFKNGISVVACLLATADGFSSMVMRTEGRQRTSTAASFNSRHAAAVVGVAAILLQSVVMAPLEAGARSSADTVGQVYVDQAVSTSKPAKDITRGPTDGARYKVKKQGFFADRFSEEGVDFGSAKGTDFGPTAGHTSDTCDCGSPDQETGGGAAGRVARNYEATGNRGALNKILH